MIRVLFIALAVVALGLAIVLGIAWLYFVAAALLVAAVVVLGLEMRQRHRKSRPESISVPVAPVDDLKSFGIMEIRPKSAPRTSATQARSAVAGSPESLAQTVEGVVRDATGADGSAAVGDGASSAPVYETAPTSRHAPTGGRTPDGSRSVPSAGQGPLFDSADRRAQTEGSTGTVRKRARTARIMVEGASDQFRAEVMLSTMRALRAAVDATTICLLAQESSPLRYRIEAIVSRNAFARHGGAFNAAKPLVAGVRTMVPVVHEMGSALPFEASRLGYYHERIAVHQVAIVPLSDGSGETWHLVADTMEHQGLETDSSVRLLSDFGRLIWSLVENARKEEDNEGIGLRPRREIIAEEMEAARAEGRPLALALVHLNGHESDAADLHESRQDAMFDFLKKLEHGNRVERFGDLTFGIFCAAEADEMAEWASRTQIHFASEAHPLDGGVAIGVAVLGNRHDGPDELRADATHALRESFETGDCAVYE